jgi:hypothetical protein
MFNAINIWKRFRLYKKIWIFALKEQQKGLTIVSMIAAFEQNLKVVRG